MQNSVNNSNALSDTRAAGAVKPCKKAGILRDLFMGFLLYPRVWGILTIPSDK